MTSALPTAALGALLHQRLAEIPCLAEAHSCALLNYPRHGNIGDHLIWVAQMHYLAQMRRIAVGYTASPDRYCGRALQQAIGGQPILLSGGGQIGDVWPRLQDFIERVVLEHPRNPLIILPQSLHFRDPARLNRAASILQGHPDLTLMLRDRSSLRLARRHFSGCRLVLAPDMAFALPIADLGLDGRAIRPPRRCGSWLALRRRDRERGAADWARALAGWNGRVTCTDWLPLERRWIWGDSRLPLSRTAATGLRELLQRRLLMPGGALARHGWQAALAPAWRQLARASPLTRLSLGMIHDGCRQLAGRDLVITDRLHAVILASLLGVPSLALDNRTGKIHGFLDSWSAWLPKVRAITAEQLPAALERAAS